MLFQIRKVVLWPRHDAAPRELTFEPNMVNVISGASKTGKSAVIPIIDYCLGSRECAIPVGTIRNACSWFGVVVDTEEGQYLFARREPGPHRYAGDFYVDKADIIDVPHRIEGKNDKLEGVKDCLNRLAGLSKLRLSADPNEPWRERVSFRELMAFVFQPQNIVANPAVLFFKADTTEHRERLRTILPYVLDAVTPRVLAAQADLARVERALKRAQNELSSIEATATRWSADGRSWLQQAMERGLIPLTTLPATWPDILTRLRQVAGRPSNPVPTVAGTSSLLARMANLRREIGRLNGEIFTHQQRLKEMDELTDSSNAYATAIELQRERLDLSRWFQEKMTDADDPFGRLPADNGLLMSLCGALAATQLEVRVRPVVRETVDKELVVRKAELAAALDARQELRRELQMNERSSAESQRDAERHASSDRFLGRLEQAIEQYDDVDRASGVREEVNALKVQRSQLLELIDENGIKARMAQALDRLQELTTKLIPKLDGEWKSAPMRLDPNELTVRVMHEGQRYFLWEIGSGANWLAYHVSMTIALQQFFSQRPHNEVPGFLVYDQPSQVYFPQQQASTGQGKVSEPQWRNESDIRAVRAVFKLLGETVINSSRPLQVIVLDHADKTVWGDLPGVTLCEEWRTEKLVPLHWLDEDTGSSTD